MFSGKSEEMIRRLRRAEIAGQRSVIFKPRIDDRYDAADVVSHAGIRMRAVPVASVVGARRARARLRGGRHRRGPVLRRGDRRRRARARRRRRPRDRGRARPGLPPAPVRADAGATGARRVRRQAAGGLPPLRRRRRRRRSGWSTAGPRPTRARRSSSERTSSTRRAAATATRPARTRRPSPSRSRSPPPSRCGGRPPGRPPRDGLAEAVRLQEGASHGRGRLLVQADRLVHGDHRPQQSEAS